MRKPLNPVAAVMWALAAVVVVIQAWIYWTAPTTALVHSVGAFVTTFWVLLRADLLAIAALASFGMIIELLDQIRWNALPPERRQTTGLWTYIRRWPDSTSP
jgi:hypothetical protein